MSLGCALTARSGFVPVRKASRVPNQLDSAAAGVASLLKSLRTRAGLQQDRLSGTELQLGALAELPLVRELREDSDSEEESIVRAVRIAADSLPATLSIVADVALRLRSLGDSAPDPDLYAPELGSRREALLRNWERLHQLRSAPPRRKPSPRTLRLDLESEALGELARVLTAPVGGASARSGPAAGEAAAGQQSVPLIDLAAGRTPLVFETFHNVAHSLREHLVREAGQPTGWPHNLRRRDARASPWATAYGLKALILLEGHLSPDLIPLVTRIRAAEADGGGWYAASTQTAPRAEVTATVIDALHAADGTADFSSELAAIDRELGEFERSRPYVLATALEAVVRIQPDARLVRELVTALLASRFEHGPYRLWPEKVLDAGLVPAAPSPVHTARAVRALSLVQAIRPSDEIKGALDEAATWLAVDSPPLTNDSEVLDRPLDSGRIEPQYFRHFTAAWVVKALVSAGLPASHPAVSASISLIWQAFSASVSLWSWSNGDLPIWMSYDAIDALRLAALATPVLQG
jgi:hypothetical protein